jgi:hypothetical protein
MQDTSNALTRSEALRDTFVCADVAMRTTGGESLIMRPP